jgi:3-phenylpropionate/cinnamic acid dioxygenase small subunit
VSGDYGTAQRDIHSLMLRYCETLDTGRIDEWVACYTHDGVFEGLKGRVQGREALHAYASASLERGFFLHLVTNIDVRLDDSDPDRATARSHLLYVERSREGAAKVAAGAQLDVLRRESGEWKIAHRKLDAHPIIDLPGAVA